MKPRTFKRGICTLILATALHGVAGLPGNWEIRDTSFTGHLIGIAAAPGQLVAVGQGGAILRSASGAAWSPAPHAALSGDFYCVTFGKGLFVAGGTLGCLMAISSDGLNWTNIQSTSSIHANFGITYGAGRFVAVGRGTTPIPNCRLITSTNGIDWETVARPTTNTLRSVTFGNGKYVAVGDHGTIITSPDTIAWTVQNSGTENLLRSIIFTGREFLAGGDSSTLLTSGDGASWSSVPFNSFDVRSLASCGTAVVGVGALAGEGRAQASADGLSWLESVSTLSVPLNAVAQSEVGRFIAVGNNGLIVESAAWADTPINIWTNTADGLWHDPFWSLGHVPSWKDHQIAFTNAGSKTLEINSATTRDYPESMLLSELILAGPEGSHNILRLNNAGLAVQLLINNILRIPPNVSLISVNSAIEAPGLHLSGRALFGENAQARFRDGISLGVIGRGDLIQTGGTISSAGVGVGGNALGYWSQFGGILEVGSGGIGIQAGGVYTLSGGLLVADSIFLTGRLELAGGTISNKLASVGGTLQANGTNALGRLVAHRTGTIDFQGGGTVVRFENSRDTGWSTEASLALTNWTQDFDHLYVGENETGLSAEQLNRIRFINPGGWAPGIYGARMTATGEVVPVPKTIAYQRMPGNLVISWPQAYQLFSSTNVSGPYQPLAGATSPFTISYIDSQRFFVLRSSP